VPDEDRAAIARALEGAAAPLTTAPSEQNALIENVPLISLEEMDRMWEGRVVRESAYHASLTSIRHQGDFLPGFG